MDCPPRPVLLTQGCTADFLRDDRLRHQAMCLATASTIPIKPRRCRPLSCSTAAMTSVSAPRVRAFQSGNRSTELSVMIVLLPNAADLGRRSRAEHLLVRPRSSVCVRFGRHVCLPPGASAYLPFLLDTSSYGKKRYGQVRTGPEIEKPNLQTSTLFAARIEHAKLNAA